MTRIMDSRYMLDFFKMEVNVAIQVTYKSLAKTWFFIKYITCMWM